MPYLFSSGECLARSLTEMPNRLDVKIWVVMRPDGRDLDGNAVGAEDHGSRLVRRPTSAIASSATILSPAGCLRPGRQQLHQLLSGNLQRLTAALHTAQDQRAFHRGQASGGDRPARCLGTPAAWSWLASRLVHCEKAHAGGRLQGKP